MTGQEAAINGWTLTDLRTRAESSAVAECLPNRSCLEPEVHELAEFVIALLDDRAALVAERDDWKRQWESAVEDIALVQGETARAVAERDRYRDALEEIAAHVIVSEGEFPDDNCDWHCTLTMQARARDALAVSTP